MRVICFGGAGFIGSHLCDSYIDDEYEVVCFDNLSTGSIWNIQHLLDCRRFRLVIGDIRDRGMLDKVIPGSDLIVLLAAQIHVDRSYIEPESTWDVNVSGTQNVLESAHLYDVPHVIFASSSEVYGSNISDMPMPEEHPMNPPHIYGASKVAADRMCYAYARTYGMNISIVRSFNVFGPRQREIGYGGVISIFLRRILSNFPPVIYGDGSQTRDYTYISDTVRAYRAITEHKTIDQAMNSQPVNFGTGVGISVNDIAIKLISLVGKDFEPVYVNPRPGEVQNLLADNTRARELYHWKPRLSFDEGLKQYVKWYLKYGNR